MVVVKKYKIKHFLGKYPKLFVLGFKLFGSQHAVNECLYSDSKEIVIEGFPRSANTFAVVAFRKAQNREVKIAHHLHVEAQILCGVKENKPVIVLIRNPEDAIKSLVIRNPKLSINWCLDRYINFYKAVEKVAKDVVIADFLTVIKNFSLVIDKVNKQFGTEYILFKHTEINMRSVFEEIEDINKLYDGGKSTHVARPVVERNKNAIVIMNKDKLNDAIRIYQKILNMKAS